MNLSLDIAKRYLFGKRSTNAINLITWISILGVAIGTAALILILSVFNGFEELISGLYNSFNPDLKVMPKEGKIFDETTISLDEILKIEGVEAVSKTLEEIALFEYEEAQEVGTIKGVDQKFRLVTNIDSTLRKGKFKIKEGDVNFGIAGVGMASKLGLNMEENFIPITVYIPKKKKTSLMDKDFRSLSLYPSGSFSVQNDHDFQYIVGGIDFVRSLLNEPNSLSFLEVKLAEGANEKTVKAKLQSLLGESFIIKNRYQQDEAFLKLMNIEKWMSFAIVCLTLLLIAFNLIGSLWMIVLDKKLDISVLKSMGATAQKIKNIFLLEGLLISGIGILSGLIIAIIVYALQKQFGIFRIAEGLIINAYPVKMKMLDVCIVILTVGAIGLLASFPASVRASKIKAFVNQNL